ncbi:MAG: sodium:calcium antiporter [Candidatus Dormibacteraeota bacterium]|nr:sodium:calcium antiporter [Candidatus Dormibacteraeota bacterium]
MSTALVFAGSVALLVVGAELFTNAVEWAGYRMRLGAGATGSLLAALGTSLPEFAVPVVALSTHAPAADSVAIGAVLGAPFLLLTLGSCITGVAVLTRRGNRTLVLEPAQPRRDLGVFIPAFSAALVCIVLPFPARVVAGALLLLAYAGYVLATLRGGTPVEEMPEPLHIVRWRAGQPHALLITLQLAVAVGMLVAGSQLFVDALHSTADALRAPELVLALVIVPLATELPETLNSVLWVRTRDDMLAFGNVAGSATFQSCILAFIGLVFTSWKPGGSGVVSGVLTLLTAGFLLAVLARGRAHGGVLLLAGLPWAGFVVAQLVSGGHLAS